MLLIKGKVHKYKDNINTDEIIPAKYLNTSDYNELAKHCMEGLDTNFVKKVQKGDILVAGRNFGCGSSREHAPVAIKFCGISCIIAESFARIFFRNAINIGLPIIETKEISKIDSGDDLEIDLQKGEIKNITKNNEIYKIQPYPEFMQKIISKGGLINYLKNDKKFCS